MDAQHPAPAQIITEQQLNSRVEALTLHRELHVGGRNDPDYWLIDTMILESKLNYVTGLMQLMPMQMRHTASFGKPSRLMLLRRGNQQNMHIACGTYVHNLLSCGRKYV